MEKEFALEEVPMIAKEMINAYASYPIWLFEGEMGSGKTTLIKELALLLEITDEVSSPTYGLVQEYVSPKGSVFHLDLFRLEKESELEILQLDEIYESARYTWIEWPQWVANSLPKPFIQILLSHSSLHNRKIRILTSC